MASPLSYLRKNQYLMLVGFGILLMFAFVVAPPLQDYLQSRAISSQDPVLIKWKYGQIRRSDLDRMALNHNVLHNFLGAVQQRTNEKGGEPKVRPLARAQSEGDLLDTMLLAKEAELKGMRVSDEAVNHYLEQLSDSVLTQKDFAELLEANNRITRTELYNRLRTELLSQNMQRLIASALPVPTPADLWKAHERLAREVNLEVLTLPVDDYVSAVTDEPTSAELNELFEAGKTLPPDSQSPEPGFYVLPKANFDYVKADFSKFLEEAKKTVTEAEIKARYESGVKLNEFRKEPDLTTTPPVSPPFPVTPEDKPAVEPKDKPADEPEDKPAKNLPPLEAPDKPADKPAKNLPPLEAPDNSATFLHPAPQYVSLQEEAEQDEPKKDEPKKDEPKKEAPKKEAPKKEAPKKEAPKKEEPKKDEPKKDEPKKDEPKKEEPKKDEPKKDEPKKDEPKKDEPKKDEPKKDEPKKDEPKKEEPKKEAPKKDEPKKDEPKKEDTTEGSPFEKDEVEFKPLEEVRDEIVLELARGRAQTKMDEALEAAERDVEAHFRKRIQWEAMKVQAKDGDKPADEPTLNVAAIAKRAGLDHGNTGLHDANSIGETDLGKCSRQSQTMFGSPADAITFAADAFRGDPKLFDPARATQGDDLTFVYWRTEMTEGRVPILSDVESQVRKAWTHIKARTVAMQDAEKLVDKAAAKDLKEVAGDKAEKVFETGRFTWLTTNNLPPQMAQYGPPPAITKVKGIDGAGIEFMEGVFSLGEDEAAVVTNRAKSEVYVVKVIEESSEEEMRADFIAEVPTTEIQLAYSATNQVFRQRLDELQRDMELVFVGIE